MTGAYETWRLRLAAVSFVAAVAFALCGCPQQPQKASQKKPPSPVETRKIITGEFPPSFAKWLAAEQEILAQASKNRQWYVAQGGAQEILADIDRDARNLQHGIDEAVALQRERLEIEKTSPEKTFNVRDYGAKGDGLTNDATAVRQAISEAMTHPNARVYLPAGTYLLGNLDLKATLTPSAFFKGCQIAPGISAKDLAINPAAHLFIHGASNLTIAGDGPDKTTLLMGVPQHGGMKVVESQNTEIRDLAIDYAALPFTQGKVLNVISDSTYDVEVDAGFPSPLDEHILKAAHGMVTRNFVRTEEGVVPLPGRYAPTYFTLEKIERLSEGTYRFSIGGSTRHASSPKKAGLLQPGNLFVLYGRCGNEHSVIEFDASKNCAARNVNIYSGPAGAFLVRRSGLVELDACNIMPKPGSTRIASNNADDVFCQSNYLGPYVHDCFMTLSGDDFLNTMANPTVVQDFSGSTFYCWVNGHSNFQPGQTLLLVEAGSYKRKYQSVIRKTTCEKIDGRLRMAIEMAEPIPDGVRSEKLTKETPGEPADRLLNLERTAPGCVVMDNKLAFGFRMILRTPNALIANNQIINRHNPSMFIILGVLKGMDEAWKVQNVTFRDNLISGIGAMFLAPQLPGNHPATAAVNRDILIENNTILNPDIHSDEELFDGVIFDIRYNERVLLKGNSYR